MAVCPLNLNPEEYTRYLDVKRPDPLDDPEGDPDSIRDLFYEKGAQEAVKEYKEFLDNESG